MAFAVAAQAPIQPPDWIYLNPTGATYTLTLPPTAPLYAFSLPWHRYDTLWYTKDALVGYQDDPGMVFLPFYGVLIALVAPFTAGNYVLASLIISNAACALAFILFYQLVVAGFADSALARRALICLAAFPTAFYLVAGYTESLFLALTLGAFLLAQRRRWWLVGALACLAALTRLQGIVLCVPLTWIALRDQPARGWRNYCARLPALVGAPLGTGIYFLILSLNHLGSPDRFYASEWHSATAFPWVSVSRFVERWLAGKTLYYEGDNALILIFFIALSLVVLWKFKPYSKLYVAVTLLVLLMRSYDTAQFDSMFRYVLLLFPCFIVLGMLLRRRVFLAAYVVLGVAWQCLLLSRFVQWIWVA